MPYPRRFDQLLAAIAAIYAAEGRPDATRTAETLLTTPAPRAIRKQRPIARHSAIAALLATSDHPTARALLGAQDLLNWNQNPVTDQTDAAIADMISVTTLMSPEGPIPAPDLRLGFVYMRPDCYYPLHIHDADETYVILAGAALWTAGDDTRHRPAGDMIHHPSLMPHAFRTGPDGMLALWRWSGDINTHSYSFVADPLALTA